MLASSNPQSLRSILFFLFSRHSMWCIFVTHVTISWDAFNEARYDCIQYDARDNMGTDAAESHSGAEKQLLDTKGNENIEAEAAEAGEEEEEWAEEEREVRCTLHLR